jgi:hypothetical protein
MEAEGAAAVLGASVRVRRAHLAMLKRKAGRIQGAADACRGHFAAQGDRIVEAARRRVVLGQPPSLRKLCGLSRLEVPMNRVLGWCFDPERRGPPARQALSALSNLVGFGTLKADIDAGSGLLVLCETNPDPNYSGREPDLMIRSERAALLLENKVDSPQSDPKQYSDYLDVLKQWAGGREIAAHLMARTRRAVPVGWTGSLSHEDLAGALRPLTSQASGLWDRVQIALLVEDLSPDEHPDRIGALRHLVKVTEGRTPTPREVGRMSRLLSRRPVRLFEEQYDNVE